MAGPRELRWISAVCSSGLQTRERMTLFGLIAALGGLVGEAATAEISKASGVCVRQTTEAMRVLTATGVVVRARRARDVAEYQVVLDRLCSAESADHTPDDDRRNAPIIDAHETRNPPIIGTDDQRNAPIMSDDDRRNAPIIACNRTASAPRAPASTRAVTNSDPGIELQERERDLQPGQELFSLSAANSNNVRDQQARGPARATTPSIRQRRHASPAQRRAAEPIVNGQLAPHPEETPLMRICDRFLQVRGTHAILADPETRSLAKALADNDEATVMAGIESMAVNCERKTVGNVLGAIERLKNPRKFAGNRAGAPRTDGRVVESALIEETFAEHRKRHEAAIAADPDFDGSGLFD